MKPARSRPRASRLGAAIAAAIGTAVAWAPAGALEIDGRYIGTYARSEITRTPLAADRTLDAMQHQLDLWTRGTTPGALDLRLRALLRYASEFGGEDSDLFRYRFHADLIASRWRIESQWVPWQPTAPGPLPPRERYGFLSLAATPRPLARLYAEWQHRERETGIGPSESDDRQALVSYGSEEAAGYASLRRIDGYSSERRAPDQTTEELRAGVRGRTDWRTVSASGEYEALFSRFSSAARRRDLDIHRLSTDVTWAPVRRVSLLGNAIQRWQATDDNVFPLPIDADETYLSGSAVVRPLDPLSLELGRDYRQTSEAAGEVSSDYLRFATTYRDRVWRDVDFLGGYRRTEELGDSEIDLSVHTLYTMLDGRIVRGISGRAEASYQRDRDRTGRRTQSRQLLQLRTTPRPSTRFDATWTRTVSPSFGGLRQLDHEWELLVGYNPVETLSLAGAYRRREAEGRRGRYERLTNATASWQPGREITVGGYWERRIGRLRDIETAETVSALDFGFWLPGELRTLVTAQRVSEDGGPRSTYYSANLQRDF